MIKQNIKTILPKQHSFITALHPFDIDHGMENAQTAYEHGADGIAVVTHHIGQTTALKLCNKIKEKRPYHKVILNILGVDPKGVFNTIFSSQELSKIIDGIWTDRAYIHGVDTYDRKYENNTYANEVKLLIEENERAGVYFGPFAFKGPYQNVIPEEEYGTAIKQAKSYLDVITTSVPGTGYEADVAKIKLIKQLAGEYPIALASGLTPNNFDEYKDYHDISIVFSGIGNSIIESLVPEKVELFAKKVTKKNKKQRLSEYTNKLFTEYQVSSYEELKRNIENNENIINISYGSSNTTEKVLSNLYPSAFKLDGVTYASIEAFRMSLKYNTQEEKEKIIDLHGGEAKKSGFQARYNKYINYQGATILCGSNEHHQLLKRALQAKFDQNPEVKNTLKESGDKKIVHIIFHKDGSLSNDSETIPSEILCELISSLRTYYQRS